MEIDVKDPIEPAANLLRTLSDVNRLRIIRVLTEDCQHVSDIVAATGLPQPLVSHHLRVLKERGLAKSERQGSFTTYCLAETWVRDEVGRIYQIAVDLARVDPRIGSGERGAQGPGATRPL
jgi:ArsR family transcriptional regulator